MHKDLATNDTVDCMNFFNCGFEFQNAIHADTVKQYDIWSDDLVRQPIFLQNNRKVKANNKMLAGASLHKIHLVS